MAGWNHTNQTGWDADAYMEYRKLAMYKAKSFRGRKEDCADLSMMLLVQFAAKEGLALTFKDNGGARYISKADGVMANIGSTRILITDLSWKTPEEYLAVVQRKIGVEALWKHNTVKNQYGPQAGDLLMIYTEKWWGLRTDRHHAALVYRPYPVGTSHPQEKDTSIPNFPGGDAAEEQVNVTEYFKGTVDPDSGVTLSRAADGDSHFDYLNSRASSKRNAELIYFANSRQATADGFEFRMYGSNVLDNWFDWDGKGIAPR
jgi:hypothetical protein